MANARPDPDNSLRKAAWRQAMEEAGLPCPEEWGHMTWPIFADQNRLGSLAAELLLRRIREPTSHFLREGMAMVLPKHMQPMSLQTTTDKERS